MSLGSRPRMRGRSRGSSRRPPTRRRRVWPALPPLVMESSTSRNPRRGEGRERCRGRAPTRSGRCSRRNGGGASPCAIGLGSQMERAPLRRPRGMVATTAGTRSTSLLPQVPQGSPRPPTVNQQARPAHYQAGSRLSHFVLSMTRHREHDPTGAPSIRADLSGGVWRVSPRAPSRTRRRADVPVRPGSRCRSARRWR